MKRMALFEFEDMPWCPGFLRTYLTNYLRSMHATLKTHEIIAPLVKRCLDATGSSDIVDLCSGGGGPIQAVAEQLSNELRRPIKVTMTDLYPNKDATRRIQREENSNVKYLETPVDAGNVPEHLTGIRTMVCSFHHMPESVASSILRDSFEKRRAICIFEISDNSHPKVMWWLAFPVAFVTTLLFTPFVRPMSLGHLITTYLFPVTPLLIAWDGAASNARTYTKSDIQELIDRGNLKSPDYEWVIGNAKVHRFPGRMLYVLGLPHI